MEIELNYCKNCFKNNEYNISIGEVNEKTNEIEFKCIKDNHPDIIKIKLNSNIKAKLNYCQKHEGNRFCAWCKECNLNLCFLCISQEKHDYTLYCDYYPTIEIYNKFKNLLKQFIYFRIDYYYLELENEINSKINKYDRLYPHNYEEKKLITYNNNYYSFDAYHFNENGENNYINIRQTIENDYKVKPKLFNDLNKDIKFFENFYKLFEEDIINYQILLNLKINYEKIIDKYKSIILEKMIKNFFNINKKLNEKHKKDIITIPMEENNKDNDYIEIITLDLEESPIKVEKEDNIEISNSKKPFVIYFQFKYLFHFYDSNGNFVKEVSHKDYIYDKCEVIQFKKNILLLKYQFKLLFFHISSNMLEYKFSNVFNFDYGAHSNEINKIILTTNHNTLKIII